MRWSYRSRSAGGDEGDFLRVAEVAPAMSDFLAAIGLFFALEGILFAGFPLGAKRAMAAALEIPDGRLRVAGLVSALVGVVIVWLVRH